MQKTSRADLITIIIAYLGFVALGMSSALFGLAWPTMRSEFGMELDAAAVFLLASTSGYLTASFFSGTLAHRLGVGRMLVLAGVVMAVGMLGIALAPAWWMVIAFMFIGSLGNGTIDAGMNAYMAQNHGARAMNWLHAFFGVGVTIGPLIMRQVFLADLSWRVGYAVVCGVTIFVTILFFVNLPRWKNVIVPSESAPAQRKSMWSVLKMPAVLLGIAMFFLVAGLEATPGTWVYTLFTEGHGISPESAALWVSIYWGSFTVGRFFFGAIVTHVQLATLVRVCLGIVLFGAVLLWWNPVEWLGFLGLTLLGFGQAPLFPVLISETPKRVGTENGGNAIGFQVAGAGLGVAILPGLAGILANNMGLNVIPAFIFVVGLLLVVLVEISLAQGVRMQQRAAASAGD